MGLVGQFDFLAAGDNFMAALVGIPLGQGGGHVHLFNDIAPTDAGIVSTEADFAFLRGVRDDALLGAAEIVIKEILEPHSGNEQEVPTILPAAFDIFERAIALDATVISTGRIEALIELL